VRVQLQENLFMRTLISSALLLAVLSLGGVTFADPAPKKVVPVPTAPAPVPPPANAKQGMLPQPTAETLKLAQYFAGKGTWVGKMAAGAMGPGSPELPTKGKYECRAITDKFWYACDVESTAGTGKTAFTWKGHMIVGWDQNAKGYRLLLVDSIGMMVPMTGEFADTKFIATSKEALVMMGQPVKARFTWDFSDPKAPKLLNEHQVASGPWQVFEQETMKPSR
jgi:hypothetical protein